MRFRRPGRNSRRYSAASGFTLAEVLAAMLFMAIVIPVAIQGMRVAGLAGEVAERKTQAARIAERVLNETQVSTNLVPSSESGTVVEGIREFQYRVSSGPWLQNSTNQPRANTAAAGQIAVTQPPVNTMSASQVTLNLLTVEVDYSVQGRDYTYRLATLTGSQ